MPDLPIHDGPHECLAPDCSRQIPADRICCPEHWGQLLPALRESITLTYGWGCGKAYWDAVKDAKAALSRSHQEAKHG